MARINVNHKVLVWARNEAHIDREDAAAKIGIAIPDLVALESGNHAPTLGELRKMAAVYQLPVATLAMPEPFKPSKLPNDFRTIGGRRERITADTVFAIRLARRYQEMLQDLYTEEENLAIHYSVPGARVSDTPITLAERERRRFGIDVESQLAWRDETQALREWRNRIEALGISVYFIDMPVEDCRGFSLKETPNPVIVVNKKEYTDGAKLFTLLHEYCHILKDRPGISNLNNRNKVEKFCNEFAARVLMPDEVLRKVLRLPDNRKTIEWSGDEIRQAAMQLHVSQQALALRLESAGYAPKQFFERFRSSQPKPRRKLGSKATGGAPVELVRLNEVGPSYAANVLVAYDRGTLNDLEAYRMLDLAPKHFEKLRKVIARRLPYHAATRPRF